MHPNPPRNLARMLACRQSSLDLGLGCRIARANVGLPLPAVPNGRKLSLHYVGIQSGADEHQRGIMQRIGRLYSHRLERRLMRGAVESFSARRWSAVITSTLLSHGAAHGGGFSQLILSPLSMCQRASQ